MRKIRFTSAAIALAALTLVGSAPARSANYAIDTSHSEIQFKVKHLGISTVTGQFSEFEGELSFDPEAVAAGRVEVTIDASSIDTANEKRDEHLRSADFFDVAEYSDLRFTSTGVKKVDDGMEVSGDLTIRGVTRPVVLEAEFTGQAVDPWGNSRVGFEASTTVNRKDFGLTWNKVLETGGLLVSEEVKIILVVQGIEQKTEPAPAS
jgi:polyisoprenoid-binding protein YceI